MTNEERQKSINIQHIIKYGLKGYPCGKEPYCMFCQIKYFTDKNACARAYNRMIRENVKELKND